MIRSAAVAISAALLLAPWAATAQDGDNRDTGGRAATMSRIRPPSDRSQESRVVTNRPPRPVRIEVLHPQSVLVRRFYHAGAANDPYRDE